jgi:hypothetical protein
MEEIEGEGKHAERNRGEKYGVIKERQSIENQEHRATPQIIICPLSKMLTYLTPW